VKDLAQKALEQLLLNESVDGIRFGPVPQILFTSQAEGKPPVKGQTYINLAARWSLYPARPEVLPQQEDDVPELPDDQQLRAICGLREAVIQKVELGNDAPHLILTFEDGRLMFINGRDDKYESWQAGIAFEPVGLTVIACPGGEIALFGAEELM